MINWLSQVYAITLFNLGTIPSRLGASVSAAVGIAGVVTVLVGFLSIAEGFRAALSTPGPDDVAVVLRSGADTEMNSSLSREETRLIADAPGIARTDQGALASAELFVVINLPRIGSGSDANVPLRGVSPAASSIRGDMKLVEGRWFETGRNEVIVGNGAARSFAGLGVGQTIKVGQNTWTVVGRFTGGGGSAESEIWTDALVLQPAYNRGSQFQALYAKLASPEKFQGFKDALTSDPRLKIRVLKQSEMLAEQSTMLTSLVTNLGVFIAALMAIGALFGALNTMYSAVSGRTREIATLRALGFGASPIIISILCESLVITLVGGSAGSALAYFAFNGYQAATINFQTFSQVAFAFAVTPKLLMLAMAWAAVLGVLGGLFPAIRAARLPVASALRAV